MFHKLKVNLSFLGKISLQRKLHAYSRNQISGSNGNVSGRKISFLMWKTMTKNYSSNVLLQHYKNVLSLMHYIFSVLSAKRVSRISRKMCFLKKHCKDIHGCLPKVICICGKSLSSWKRLLIHKRKHYLDQSVHQYV